MLKLTNVANLRQQMAIDGAIVILAKDATDASRALCEVRSVIQQTRRGIYVALTENIDAAALNTVNANPRRMQANTPEDKLWSDVQTVYLSKGDVPLAYTENAVRRIADFIATTEAKVVIAPALEEQQAERLNLNLAAREAIRRINTQCMLLMYCETGNSFTPYFTGIRPPSAESMPAPSGRLPGNEVNAESIGGTLSLSQPVQARSGASSLYLSPTGCSEPIRGLRDWEFPHRSSEPPPESALVSVIIRSRNRPELAVALDSIAAQTHDRIEVLLIDVDGKCAFDVPMLCGSFPVRLVSSGAHFTRGAAANAGLRAARGAYISFLDDDDWLHPDHVATLVKALQDGQPALAAYSGIECCAMSDTGDWEKIKIFNQPFNPIRLLIENYLPIHAVMFASCLLDSQLRFEEHFEVYEDWDFWIQLSQLTPFIHVDRITAVYRISATSGFGLRNDDPAIARGTKSLFGKWRKHWTESQVIGFIEYLKRQVQEQAATASNQEVELTARIAESENQLADLKRDREIKLKYIEENERELLRFHRDRERLKSLDELAEKLSAIYEKSQDVVSLRKQVDSANAQRARLEQLLTRSVEREERLASELKTSRAEISRAHSELTELRWVDRRATLFRHKFQQEALHSRRLTEALQRLQSAATWPLVAHLNAFERRFPKVTRALRATLKSALWVITFRLPARLRLRRTALRVLKSGLFDEQSYCYRYPDVLLSGYLPVYHWCLIGWINGYDPNPLFHSAWYLENIVNARIGDADPLLHYLDNGASQHLDPNPLFDSKWYVGQNPDWADTGGTPLLHYLNKGRYTGCAPHPLFNPSWYLANNPGLASAENEPLAHYFEVGAYDDCDPHPLFMSSWYLKNNPDVDKERLNPLVHFLQYGASEGRDPNPFFDSDWYLSENPVVSRMGLNPLVHYVLFGAVENLCPHAEFDPRKYKASHSSVNWDKEEPLAHFLRCEQVQDEARSDRSNSPSISDIVYDAVSGRPIPNANPPEYARWLQVNPLGPNRKRSLALGSGMHVSRSIAASCVLDRFDRYCSQVTYVTFDLFDTLVERMVSEPADVFRIVGIEAPKTFGGPEAYTAARIAAEAMARSRSVGEEIKFDAIFDELQRASACRDSDIERLRRRELELELGLIRAKPLGRLLFERAIAGGKRIAVLTDTYFPATFVTQVLEQSGYTAYDELLVSSEMNATKHHGSMFEEWGRSHDIDLGNVLHVGDNEHSDVAVPRELGSITLHAPRSIDEFRMHPARARAWAKSNPPDIASHLMQGAIANKLAAVGVGLDTPAPYFGNPYLLGYATLGPVLLGFTLALLEFARRRGVRHLCFLARDGYVLKEAYDAIVPHMKLQLPVSSYVAASRSLCAGADLDSVDRVLEVAAVPHHPMPIRDLLINRFCLDELDVCCIPQAEFTQQGLSGPDDVVAEKDERKVAFVRAVARRLIAASERRAERYAGYLNSFSIDYEHAAVVDIGYAGSAQRVISRLTKAQVQGFYAITSDRIENVRMAGLHSEGWLADGVSMGDHWFFEHVQNWELFFSASHGSTIDITVDEAGAFGVKVDDNLYPESVRRTLAAIHRGAVEFARDFVVTNRPHLQGLVFNPERCCGALREYFLAPDPADCVDLSEAVFEDRFGGDARLLAAAVHPRALAFEPVRRVLLWYEATAALSGASPTPAATVYPEANGRSETVLGQASAFIDGFSGISTAASWKTQEFDRVFDSDGWPAPAARPVSMRLIFPLLEMDPPSTEALKSISEQAFSGLAVSIAAFENVSMRDIPDRDGVKRLHVVKVRSWADVVDLMKSVEEEWVVLNDGHTAFDGAFAAELAARISQDLETDVIVFDDDWRRADGTLERPHFKPTWSRELLLCTDYFGGAFAVRRAFLGEVQACCHCGSAVLWELALRATAATERVARIPRVLAHRSIEAYEAKLTDARDEIRPVLADVMAKLGAPKTEFITPNWSIESKRLVLQPVFDDDGPRVAIIIPTKNQHKILRRCIESLWTSTYQNFQIYLVDNESDESASIAYFEQLAHKGVTVLRIRNQDGAFSYSYVNNRAVEQTDGEPYLLFLNNDTEVIEPRWLSQMVGWQQLRGVGSVGARLLFANGTIQHAGITHGLLYNVLPAPSLKCLPGDQGGYQDYLYLTRDSAAQTAACLLTPRSVFLEHGMFDEKDFGVAYNDCDYGFKLAQHGLKNVYCADAILYHHEGYSRGVGRGNDKPSEEAAFVRKYANWTDPFYNPNLALGQTDFAIKPVSPVTTPVPKLRVALISHNLNYEGAPRVLYDIGVGLQAASAAEVYVLSPEMGALQEAYESKGCAVHIDEAWARVFASGKQGIEAVAGVAAFLTEHRIDVVIGNTVLCWWGLEAAALSRLPSLWIIHESEPPFSHLAEHGNDFVKRGRDALALPYRVVFVAEATRAVFSHLETVDNFVVYHNGYETTDALARVVATPQVDARRILGLPDDRIIGLLPGTVTARKGQMDVVRAVRSIGKETLERLCLVILGDRPSDYSTALHAELASLHPDYRDIIRVLDYQPGAEIYFRAADFMISTSRIEAFPRVVQEAMFFQLPMIVAPVYGIQEQLQDEVSALFFQPGDTESLARQIERLVSDGALRRRLGNAARDSLDRFPTVVEMVSYYETLIKQAWLSY